MVTEVISTRLVLNTETVLLLLSADVFYNQSVTTQRYTVQNEIKQQVEACKGVDKQGADKVCNPGRRKYNLV